MRSGLPEYFRDIQQSFYGILVSGITYIVLYRHSRGSLSSNYNRERENRDFLPINEANRLHKF